MQELSGTGLKQWRFLVTLLDLIRGVDDLEV